MCNFKCAAHKVKSRFILSMPGKISPAEDKEKPQPPSPALTMEISEQNKPEKRFLQKSICLWYPLWSAPKKQKKKVRSNSMFKRVFCDYIAIGVTGFELTIYRRAAILVPKAWTGRFLLIYKGLRAFRLGIRCEIALSFTHISGCYGAEYGRVCGQEFWVRFPVGEE